MEKATYTSFLVLQGNWQMKPWRGKRWRGGSSQPQRRHGAGDQWRPSRRQRRRHDQHDDRFDDYNGYDDDQWDDYGEGRRDGDDGRWDDDDDDEDYDRSRSRSRSPTSRSSRSRRPPVDVRRIAVFGDYTSAIRVFPKGQEERADPVPKRPGRRSVAVRWFVPRGGAFTRFTGAKSDDWHPLCSSLLELTKHTHGPDYAVICVSPKAVVSRTYYDFPVYPKLNTEEIIEGINTALNTHLAGARLMMPFMCHLVFSVVPPEDSGRETLARIRGLSESLRETAKKNDALFVDVEAVLRRELFPRATTTPTPAPVPQGGTGSLATLSEGQLTPTQSAPSGDQPVTESRLQELRQQLRQELREELLQELREELRQDRQSHAGSSQVVVDAPAGDDSPSDVAAGKLSELADVSPAPPTAGGPETGSSSHTAGASR